MGTNFTDLTTGVQAKTRVDKEAVAQELRNIHRDQTARQDSGSLVTSQHAGAMQDGEPDKLQQQQ
jgi:hypothetical protein